MADVGGTEMKHAIQVVGPTGTALTHFVNAGEDASPEELIAEVRRRLAVFAGWSEDRLASARFELRREAPGAPAPKTTPTTRFLQGTVRKAG